MDEYKYAANKARLREAENLIRLVEGESPYSRGRLPDADITHRMDLARGETPLRQWLKRHGIVSTKSSVDKVAKQVLAEYREKEMASITDKSFYIQMLNIIGDIDIDSIPKQLVKRLTNYEVLPKLKEIT